MGKKPRNRLLHHNSPKFSLFANLLWRLLSNQSVEEVVSGLTVGFLLSISAYLAVIDPTVRPCFICMTGQVVTGYMKRPQGKEKEKDKD